MLPHRHRNPLLGLVDPRDLAPNATGCECTTGPCSWKIHQLTDADALKEVEEDDFDCEGLRLSVVRA
jgi:hypothetical protein